MGPATQLLLTKKKTTAVRMTPKKYAFVFFVKKVIYFFSCVFFATKNTDNWFAYEPDGKNKYNKRKEQNNKKIVIWN